MTGWSLKLCRVMGIRLEVHVTFLILLGVVAWQGYGFAGWYGMLCGVVAIVLIFGSVLLHELGHCVAARRYGIPVPRILLLPIGGMAEMTRSPRNPKAELVITAAGPSVNFVISGVLYLLVGAPDRAWYFTVYSLDPVELAQMLVAWNVVMGVFNLLPVFPMDGGRILRASLALGMDYGKATRIAVYIAKGLVVLGVAVAVLWLDNYLLAALFIFIWFGGDAEYRQVRFMEKYGGLTIGDIAVLWYGDLDGELLKQRPPLSARWPLEVYAPLFEAEKGAIYPVYDGERFVGVVNTGRFEEAVAKAREGRS